MRERLFTGTEVQTKERFMFTEEKLCRDSVSLSRERRRRDWVSPYRKYKREQEERERVERESMFL